MHEIGHNSFLGHYNDDETHGCFAGVMGSTSSETHGPKKINVADIQQLGWHADSAHVVDTKALKKNEVNQHGLCDVLDNDKRVKWVSKMIKFINSNDGFDYCAFFNSKSDVNSGTTDKINEALATRKQTG